MTSQHQPSWPVAELDPIRRLRVLTESVPALTMTERMIPLEFDRLWQVASDLERTFPNLGGGYVTSLHVIERDGERMVADVRGRFGLRDTFAITLRPGWCWMEGRVLTAAMAARPEAGGTRFAWASQVKLPGGRLLNPAARLSLHRTLERLERLATDTRMPPG
jgi:hypothetical protein